MGSLYSIEFKRKFLIFNVNIRHGKKGLKLVM